MASSAKRKMGFGSGSFGLLLLCGLAAVAGAQRGDKAAGRDAAATHGARPHNVIVFVADGLRRGSVTEEDMPTFMRVRREGVDFANSHAVFPTFTTANASAIATGHGLGDTGDYSNAIWPGVWLTKPQTTAGPGEIVPFLENDQTLADMNAVFRGNYLGEQTFLSAARAKGYSVASVGKLGPTAIQQIDAVGWDQLGLLSAGDAVIVDDATGGPQGLPLPIPMREAMAAAGLPLEAPLRSNGYGELAPSNNGFAGDASTPGTLEANVVQEQWFADVSTRVLLPGFAAAGKPFALLFWSRDPDGTQHNQGDSLQSLKPGINGETSRKSLRNADRCLKQLLDWLDAHPAVKAETDVIVTSDHGFSTISRREIAADGTQTVQPSTVLLYALAGKEKAEPLGTLPTGFLGVDLAVRGNMRLFDPTVRANGGDSVYQELQVGGELSQHPAQASALLGDQVTHVDGSDARVIVAANGGSDLLYVPSGDPKVVRALLTTLGSLDYVGGLFVDDRFCSFAGSGAAADCPGALPMSAIGLVGASKVPRPAIAVTYKVFYTRPGDLQSAGMISDTSLQEGQGMHGGFGREQTLNNMAAMGPDFARGVVDGEPVGNIDLAPTIEKILGLEVTPLGTLRGRVVTEAMRGSRPAKADEGRMVVSAPMPNGNVTVLEYQEQGGTRYLDRACVVGAEAARKCP